MRESAAVAVDKLNANSRAMEAMTGGIPMAGADDSDAGRLPRGQYFQTSQAMTATVTDGKLTMSASCSARH